MSKQQARASSTPAPAAPAQGPAAAAPVDNSSQVAALSAAAPPTDYNTSWMDALPEAVRSDIDMKYSVDDAIAARPEVKALDKQIQAARRGKKADPVKLQELTKQRADLVERLRPELLAGKVGPVGRLDGAESADDRIFTSELSREEGRDVVRDNFMNVMVGLFGSEEAVQGYFKQIRPAGVPGGPWLHDRAARRLEAARKDFEAEFPGVKFLSSTVAWAMRGRQNVRQGRGMLSHATGMAIDYKAYENPHLKDWQHRVLIETVTGSKARLELNNETGQEYGWVERRKLIKKLGKQTEAGQAHGAKEGRLVGEELDASFDEHASLDDRLNASLDVGGSDEVGRLRALAAKYWQVRGEIGKAKKTLGQHKQAYGKVYADAKRRVQAARLKELDQQLADAREAVKTDAGGSATRAMIAGDPLVQSLHQQKAELKRSGPARSDVVADEKVAAAQATIDAAQAAVDALVQPFEKEVASILEPWLAKLDARLKTFEPALGGFDPADLPTQKLVDQALGRVKLAQRSKKPQEAIAAIKADPRFAVLFKGAPDKAFADLAALRTHLLGVLAMVKGAAKAKESIDAIAKVKDRMLHDLDFVVGASAKRTVSDPSLLQILDTGLVTDEQATVGAKKKGEDPGEAPMDDKASQISYFKEFTRTMMSHGFEAGGAWESADTMHFELVEGMEELQDSTRGTTYGARGKQPAKPK